MVRYLDLTKDLFRRPSHVFKDIANYPKEYFPGSIVLLIVMTILSAISVPLIMSKSLAIDSLISPVVLGALYLVLIPIGTLIGVGIMLLGSKIFKGHATYKKLFNAFMHVSLLTLVLFIPNMVVLFFLPLLSQVFGTITNVWTIILTVIAFRETNGFSTGKAVGALLIPLLILMAVGAIIGVFLVGFLIAAA